MDEQLISFETAKLAKEKGLPQDDFYFENYEVRVPFYGLDNELNKGDEDRFGQCKSISQSLLQKWLREKYSIYAESRYNETFNYFEDYVFYNNNYPKPTCIQKDVHSTYEIGLEFALIEALNLIDSDLVIDNEG